MAPSVNLKKAGRPLPAANAHRHHRQPRIAMASLQQGVTGNTGAGHSIGMTHGNRPAVHVITIDWFEKDKDFDLEAYAAQSFGSFHSEAEFTRVVWLFSPAAAATAQEFEFHPKQEMVEEEDGGLLVTFEASGLVEMAWHWAKWGDAVEVIEPAALREMVASFQNSRITVLP
jgi:hypothetical protein